MPRTYSYNPENQHADAKSVDLPALSPQRRKVMDFLVQELRCGRGMPELEVVQAYMGYRNTQSCVHIMDTLAAYRYLVRGDRRVFKGNVRRSWRVSYALSPRAAELFLQNEKPDKPIVVHAVPHRVSA